MLSRSVACSAPIVLAFLLSSPTSVFGQVFTVAPSSISGVELISPESPEFAELVEAQYPQAPSKNTREIELAFTVAVRNAGSRPIRAVAVRMDYLNGLGQLVQGVYVNEYKQGAELSTDFYDFFTPTGPLRSMMLGVSQSGYITRLDQLKQSPRITISLDAIVFDDGELVGPDLSGTFELMVREGVEMRKLIRTLQSFDNQSDQTVSARLMDIADAPIVFDRHYFGQLRMTAHIAKMRFTGSTRSMFHEYVTELSRNPPVLDVWRTKQQVN